ncbi:DUF3558 domain-containing protein [Streptoalloteichus tenebrarius]|uniref:DUF3558 domain-containing protein n=1 Tax=Streptoalloteichus tenebrarius (strain ATCC 17920 / DSM 40477 / JCM 4838 / CBS 697.72 / NBRC 16177 / NCIMB 11028 / NRRL B-12390 / A12253. 1 / ISP 5477) TaxID=1933 RepID=UPI0035EBF92D|nr:DUF3558 domain-containing protein [Streptoalloteichus tenebrarius]
MSKKITKIAVPILGALLLASCSGGSVQGTAQPTGGLPNSASASSDALPPGVPRVPKPLDTARFQQDPCSILTAAQLQPFKLTGPGLPRKDPFPYCQWPDMTNQAKMSLSVSIATDRDGLAGLYQRQKNFKVFEPLTIEDYPGVIVATALDQRPQGVCDVEFAVTDKLSISVRTNLSTPDRATNPCGPTKAAAAEVLKTLKATN